MRDEEKILDCYRNSKTCPISNSGIVGFECGSQENPHLSLHYFVIQLHLWGRGHWKTCGRGNWGNIVGEVAEAIWGSDGVEEPWRGCGLPPGREAEARPPVTTRQVDKSPLPSSYLLPSYLSPNLVTNKWYFCFVEISDHQIDGQVTSSLSPLIFGHQQNSVFVLCKFCHQWQANKTRLTFPMHSILSSIQILSPIWFCIFGGNLAIQSEIKIRSAKQ